MICKSRQEAFNLPHLTVEEEEELIVKYKTEGCQKSKLKLLKHHERLIYMFKIAPWRSSHPVETDTLNSECMLYMLEALEDYQLGRGARFATWAIRCIKQKLAVYKYNAHSVVKKPIHNSNKHIYFYLDQLTTQFWQTNPNATEEECNAFLCAKLNCVPSALNLVKDSLQKTFSLEAMISDSFQPVTLQDHSYLDIINDLEEQDKKVIFDKCFKKLPERYQTVLISRYLSGGDKPLQFRAMGDSMGEALTKQRYKQLEAAAINKMREMVQRYARL